MLADLMQHGGAAQCCIASFALPLLLLWRLVLYGALSRQRAVCNGERILLCQPSWPSCLVQLLALQGLLYACGGRGHGGSCGSRCLCSAHPMHSGCRAQPSAHAAARLEAWPLVACSCCSWVRPLESNSTPLRIRAIPSSGCRSHVNMDVLPVRWNKPCQSPICLAGCAAAITPRERAGSGIRDTCRNDQQQSRCRKWAED